MRWLRVAVGVVTLSALATFGVVFGSYVFRDRPGPRSVSSALKQFRAGTTTAPAAAASVQRPTAGVYELDGTGTEHISFPPNSQRDGAVMPASVTYLADACWRWHVDYNVAHWEEYDFCVRGGQLVQVANRNSQSWDFGTTKIKNLANFTCTPALVIIPANPQPGQVTIQSCVGRNTAVTGETVSSGPIRIVGIDTLSIGGLSTPAVHEIQETQLSGGQKGTVTENWWLVEGSGLPVRMDRQISIDTSSPLGTITYTESGSWQMTSLAAHT